MRTTSEMELDELFVERDWQQFVAAGKVRKMVERKFALESLEKDIEGIVGQFEGIYQITGPPAIGKTTRLPRLISERLGKRVVVICETSTHAALACSASNSQDTSSSCSSVALSFSVIGNNRVAYVGAKVFLSLMSHEGKFVDEDVVLMLDESHVNRYEYRYLKEILEVLPSEQKVYYLTATPQGRLNSDNCSVKQLPNAIPKNLKGRVLKFCESGKHATELARKNGGFCIDSETHHFTIASIIRSLKENNDVVIYCAPEMSCGLNLDVDYVIDCDTVVYAAVKRGELVYRKKATPVVDSFQRMKRLNRFGKIDGVFYSDAKLQGGYVNVETDPMNNALVAWFKAVIHKREHGTKLNTREEEAFEWLIGNLTTEIYFRACQEGREWFELLDPEFKPDPGIKPWPAAQFVESRDVVGVGTVPSQVSLRRSVEPLTLADLVRGRTDVSFKSKELVRANWTVAAINVGSNRRDDFRWDDVHEMLEYEADVFTRFGHRYDHTLYHKDVRLIVWARNKICFSFLVILAKPDPGEKDWEKASSMLGMYRALWKLWDTLKAAFGSVYTNSFVLEYRCGAVVVETSDELYPSMQGVDVIK